MRVLTLFRFVEMSVCSKFAPSLGLYSLITGISNVIGFSSFTAKKKAIIKEFYSRPGAGHIKHRV